MASENSEESAYMLNAPPTPGTGDVEDWEDGGFEELMKQELAREFSGSEREPGTITTDEDGDLEAELAAEMFSSDIDEEPDPVGVEKSNALEDRIPQKVAAKERAKFKPDTQKVANNFFKAPARESQAHTRTGSNASAMAPISSLSTTSKLAKVPAKSKFTTPVPKFNSKTIIQGGGKVTTGSKLAAFTGTKAAAREAARLAKIADIKVQKKSVEDRRASMGIQATAKGEFDNKAAQTIGEVMHTVTKKPKHYHPDGEKRAMAMETSKASMVSTKANPEQKGVAVPVSRKKQMDPSEAKTAHDLTMSKMRSEAVLKGKKKKDAEVEREESKRVAKLAMANNLAAMAEHLQQGEMERQVKTRQLSDHYLAQAAAKNKRKRPDSESSAPLKKTKNPKKPVHKDLSSPHADEQEDENEASDEMEGVTVERKILAHKKTREKSAPSSKKRRA
ncbi:hypothetical protein E6O75_ATG06258 [Venturia nashicola]|uniref:Uncharacterized protein n=1 Tax=Venturia nashicola TaxID=86259 RepID=A0A4Z1NWY8_9PEZI|nr:hypothetical protein E6O75_ATG06258 [Venturia nashicola]